MKMQLHKFLGLSGSEELAWKGPRGGGPPSIPAVGTNTWHCKSNCLHPPPLQALEPWGAHCQQEREGKEGGQAPSPLLWMTVSLGEKPLRPGDSRHLTAAGAEPSVSEHPSAVQEGAGARSWSCR